MFRERPKNIFDKPKESLAIKVTQEDLEELQAKIDKFKHGYFDKQDPGMVEYTYSKIVNTIKKIEDTAELNALEDSINDSESSSIVFNTAKDDLLDVIKDQKELLKSMAA